jgi:hypothetical protein
VLSQSHSQAGANGIVTVPAGGDRMGIAWAMDILVPLWLGSEARGIGQSLAALSKAIVSPAQGTPLTNPQLVSLSSAHAGYANADGLPGGAQAKICLARWGQRMRANLFRVLRPIPLPSRRIAVTGKHSPRGPNFDKLVPSP